MSDSVRAWALSFSSMALSCLVISCRAAASACGLFHARYRAVARLLDCHGDSFERFGIAVVFHIHTVLQQVNGN
jgi:hypothetical protein